MVNMEFDCPRCGAAFRTHSEMTAHQRSHLTGRPTPGMKKTGSLREELRAARQHAEVVESKAHEMERELHRTRREVESLRGQLKELQARRLVDQQALIDQRLEREQRQLMVDAVAAFSDEELAAMGITREEAEARIPEVSTPVQIGEDVVIGEIGLSGPVENGRYIQSRGQWLQDAAQISAMKAGTAMHSLLEQVINTKGSVDAMVGQEINIVLDRDGKPRVLGTGQEVSIGSDGKARPVSDHHTGPAMGRFRHEPDRERSVRGMRSTQMFIDENIEARNELKALKDIELRESDARINRMIMKDGHRR